MTAAGRQKATAGESATSSPGIETFAEVMVPNYTPAPFVPVRGQGSRVWDQQGREYLDFAGGIAVLALGHNHPAVVAALHEQADRLWHLSNFATNEPALRLARKLIANTFAERIYFANSGGEANEAALKLARRYQHEHGLPDKKTILACENSFHGRTLFCIAVSGQEKYRQGYQPLPAGVAHGRFNDLASMAALFDEHTAAVIVEPIQGESGVLPADQEFLHGLRKLCDDHGALLIFDEVQSGMGRTGKLYAYMRYGVTPDILTTAKALGNGFPVAAMLTTEAIARCFSPGSHGSTYGGNPLACAVAGKVFDLINDPALLEDVQRKSELLATGLRRIGSNHNLFGDIRYAGLWVGCELQENWQGRAAELMATCYDAGLMTLVAGPNVLRLAPALTIPEADLEEGLRRLSEAAEAFCGQ